MKNAHYIINGILAVAVIVLFILHFSGGKRNQSDNNGSQEGDSIRQSLLPVAYIRTDSLLNNYMLFKDLNEASMKELENHRLDINQRKQRFEKEVKDFQQKVQLNAFITQERMNQEGARLEKTRNDLERYAAQIEQNLSEKQMHMQLQLQDSVLSGLKLFNAPQKYQIIFSNIGTDNFYYVNDAYDITKEVVDFLNARYTPAKE
ncbi:MAG: OmpH family outer membrane protein [Dysgonamonadaceae bacterium]|jgi:outer membrane protein|nr:OmpH family outer membrane protein [Dysgonamonadaceae bacterium]